MVRVSCHPAAGTRLGHTLQREQDLGIHCSRTKIGAYTAAGPRLGHTFWGIHSRNILFILL